MKSELTMTDKELKRILNKIDSRLDNIDSRLDNIDENMSDVKERLHRIETQTYSMSTSLGKLTEILVNVPEIKINGIKFYINKANIPVDNGEIDLIYTNDEIKAILFIEVKTSLLCSKIGKIANKLQKNAQNFIKNNSTYRTYAQYYALAGLKIIKDTKRCDITDKAKQSNVTILEIESSLNRVKVVR